MLLRSVFDDPRSGRHVGAVLPGVLVEHSASGVAVFQPAGTTMLIRTGRRGGPTGRTMHPGGWDGGHAEVPWTGPGVLRAHPLGCPWSVWRWQDPAAPDGWRADRYVNLEQPWRRSGTGFDTADWILDLVVDRHGGCTRKDADELAWAQQQGAVTAEHATLVRRTAADAERALRTGDWPGPGDWRRWRPDPNWRAPDLRDAAVRERALRP